VELDTFLNDKPVQHREVMKQESSLFKSYFEDMVIMSGGYLIKCFSWCLEISKVYINSINCAHLQFFNKEYYH